MADVQPDSKSIADGSDIEFRRYEARLGLWKVIWGTAVVGLAGILIPGAINFYSAIFENWRKEAELKLATQTANQNYIKEFFNTAVNQDIELRIRFANYFANLSDADQRLLWAGYLTDLKQQRDSGRNTINRLEGELVALKRVPPNDVDVAELDETLRKLNWAYSEVGYVPLDRSVVTAPVGKKERLYNETINIVEHLATLSTPIDAQSPEYIRFWELYQKDLIGVESREVARTMIAIGVVLKTLAAEYTPPTEQLRKLSGELLLLMKGELDAEAGNPSPSVAQTQSAR